MLGHKGIKLKKENTNFMGRGEGWDSILGEPLSNGSKYLNQKVSRKGASSAIGYRILVLINEGSELTSGPMDRKYQKPNLIIK
ncbi:hypothetical protein ACSAZL_16735 [Methanosarcina sp. T3]|uniref:hypothetical protein n=1 Tax=Methanosarcina sp. T3 TaxID=3439062 RepID=UPI003F879EB5